jgi:hypothetical protein
MTGAVVFDVEARAAMVTHAVFEARAAEFGGPVTAGDIAVYVGPDADAGQAVRALRDAEAAGLVRQDGEHWHPTPAAENLRGVLEQWYYAT